ncbi:putative transcriptional regulatory protein [Diplogelasinospora grovesii]|uniref:Transcriptional regulatory protein n=1 Tax=Diplogelasinospora grovesii TaxID=303347 RepID=A0AAN6N4M6_9PEZI|nr:putative transcriptional regulatory protein [Diplogelasinospora grovesii]
MDSTTRQAQPPSQQQSKASRASSTSTNDKIAPGAVGFDNSPDMSDDESVDSSPHDNPSPSESVKSSSAGQGPIKSESEGPHDGASSAHDASTAGDGGHRMPVQKRRRVTRACDECRRKKIKCDGKQPCTHCSVYSYECTYDKPSNRRRNPAPQYVEALEARLQRAEALLREYMPGIDLEDRNLDPTVQQEFRNRERARAQAMKPKREAARNQEQQQHENPDAQIMSMIETIGQLDLNEGGEWDFHGISSGAVFLRRMKEHFQGLLGNDYRIPFLPRPSRPAGMFSLDSPRSNASSPWDVSALPNIYDLPPKEKVRELCYYSLSCATCLLRVVHEPSFYEMLEKLYEQPQDSWGNAEHRFLGLLYSVMALGCMYNISEDDPSSPPISYKAAMDEGIKYYASARLILQDIAECRDMISLQGLIFMILFLQATSHISGCYAFIGIALRSSLRMGLHRHLPHVSITPIEDQTRRRVFHVVRQMDIYVSAILGFPMLLRDEDVDQPRPTEVDDEYITQEAILTPPPGTPSFFQAFNAHSRLMAMLAKVVKHIYPLKGVEECVMNGGRPNATYMISYARIKEIERELHEWYEQLPIYWRPSPEGPIEVIRTRTLLRFGYAHVQMMLYRPFLHYVSPRLTAGKTIDERYYACAAAGISVSRNIVHIGIEIQKQAVLIGPYWFILYTEFFAILSLVFYALENPDKPGSMEILADARAGRDVIATLAQRSLAADRVTNALNVERLKMAKARPPQPTKKRSAPAPGAKIQVPLQPASAPAGLPQRRSDEIIRPHQQNGVPVRRETVGPGRLQHRTSLDALGLQQQDGMTGQDFGNPLHDLLPLDMSMTATSSEAGSTPGTSASHRQHRSQAFGSGGVYPLDASMMFSSGDPFAYPNHQPLMDLPAANRQQQQQQQQDAMQFFMPTGGIYDDIEGQLLGPIPSYLLQQQQQAAHQHGLDLDMTSQMYGNAANMATLQQRGRQQSQQQQQQLAQQQQQQQQQRLQHNREIEEMLAAGDPTFRAGAGGGMVVDWGDILGTNTTFR